MALPGLRACRGLKPTTATAATPLAVAPLRCQRRRRPVHVAHFEPRGLGQAFVGDHHELAPALSFRVRIVVVVVVVAVGRRPPAAKRGGFEPPRSALSQHQRRRLCATAAAHVRLAFRLRNGNDPVLKHRHVPAPAGDHSVAVLEEAYARHVGGVASVAPPRSVLHQARRVHQVHLSVVVSEHDQFPVCGAAHAVGVCAVPPLAPDAHHGKPQNARPRVPDLCSSVTCSSSSSSSSGGWWVVVCLFACVQR
mmetsp:Transcript_30238/g.51028  ORF Transcript_30238/g.51028 Transcript_30238/m.51028 type:complete len:251 (+) Transcript_30238:123-875(+)